MSARRLATCTALFAIAGAVVTPPAAQATTISVDCAQQALQPKLQNAPPGSTILIKGNCVGTFGIAKNLTLKGNPTATLDADSQGTTLNILGARQVHLRSLVITGGSAANGAGVNAPDGGALTLDHVTLQANTASGQSSAAGGGISMSDGVLTVRASTISNNTAIAEEGASSAGKGGGIDVEGGSLTIEDSVIAGNLARGGSSNVNSGFGAGGGVYAFDAGVTATSTTFKFDHAFAGAKQDAMAQGGAVNWEAQTTNDLLLSDTKFTKNFATAISVDGSAATQGGTVEILLIHQGSAAVVGSTFEGNHARVEAQNGEVDLLGGALDAHAAAANIRVASTRILDTTGHATGGTSATAEGGALDIGGTANTLAGSTISGTTLTADASGGNAIVEGGGAIAVVGALTVSRSSIDGNQATATSEGSAAFAGGGGIATDGQGTLVLRSSTVSNNHATSSSQPASSEALGGGIDLEVDAAGDQITNSTITLNSADATGGNAPDSAGGGIDAIDGSLTVRLSTIVHNHATASGTNAFAGGGGLEIQQGSTTFEGLILALNTATTGPNCQGTPVSDGFNLFGDLTGCGVTPVGSDQSGVTAPKLGQLHDNGGPTNTVALLAGSPALDRIGTATCHTLATKDQRGIARPQGAKCDEGAFERTTSRR